MNKTFRQYRRALACYAYWQGRVSNLKLVESHWIIGSDRFFIVTNGPVFAGQTILQPS